jgi:hypothetical protein
MAGVARRPRPTGAVRGRGGTISPPGKRYRITLTLPVINQAAVVTFLVSGRDKAETLNEVLEGSQPPELFTSKLIHPANGRLTGSGLSSVRDAPLGRASPPVGDFPQTVPDGVLEKADDMPRMLKLVDVGPYLGLPCHVMSG